MNHANHTLFNEIRYHDCLAFVILFTVEIIIKCTWRWSTSHLEGGLGCLLLVRARMEGRERPKLHLMNEIPEEILTGDDASS